ncbi:lamin tail domain-containing protein [Heyndrickxia sporothermodurans]|uniref:lamin tail domain-containing protein n=1 Tax=Heyndrickxia sporothermodurans TaxID=46224 RepID=UPI002DBC79A3|nr:lamin tail domain-containing protein [Heyndrickxia sporothermodurans]MEB6550864.1 lamin tail domain-containing protein [Heyndrickxia sporothermodurans]
MKKSCKWIIFALSVVLVFGNVFTFHSSKTNASENVTVPNLLITEVVPDTDNYAGLDAFEYVEIYNNSDKEIDLEGYHIQSGNWNVKIDHSIKVAPWDTIVFWTRRAEIQPLTFEAFNQNYYASYQSKYLDENNLQTIDNVGGLVNSNTQTVTVSDPNGKAVVRATYTGADVYTNKSITFSYPLDGSITMKTISGNQPPTPGWLVTKQAPPRPKNDDEAPSIPENIASVIGNGTISLTWNPNTESDIYRYNIYKDGKLEFSVSPDKHEFNIYSLIGNRNYTIQMTAEDLSGNESAKSIPITATPKHQLITQEERSSNDRNPKYEELWRFSQDGPIIPGLVQDLVPQGLGYYKKKNWLLTINYLSDGRPGTLCVIDAETEKLIKSIVLYNQDGTPYTGHAGGVAVSKEHVWIASENFLFTLNINDVVSARNNDEIRFTNQIPVPVEAAYDVYDDDNGILWVGEFYEPNSYPTDSSHHQVNRAGKMQFAWMVGYKIKSNTDMIAEEQWSKKSNQTATPNYVLSTIGKVQGAVVEKKGISLVTSYGRANDSVLYRYKSPLKEEPHEFVTINGKEIPLWFLDGETAKPRKSITAIPMKEGAVLVKKQLYVSFESGANKYRYTGTYPRDRMLKIDMKTLMKDDKEIIKQDGKIK